MTRQEVPVLQDSATRAVYATDNSIYQVKPDAVVLPTSAAEVSAIVRTHRNKPIVARGGGTGTNGQALTPGLVIDVKRHLNRIVEIRPDERLAIVEAGVVASDLNSELEQYGLFWAPHTSTLNRATVGGMIATDAAGKGSLRYGRTHRHVAALEVVLDDGTPWRAEPTRRQDVQQQTKAPDRPSRILGDLLDLKADFPSSLQLPELARGFSGYGIDRLFVGETVDPLALLCGSEGTLAMTTTATVRLSPLPGSIQMVLVGYASFGQALEDSLALRTTSPTAIEAIDEHTLEQGRASACWPALEAVVSDDVQAILLLEYAGSEPVDVGSVQRAIKSNGRARSMVVVTDRAQQRQAWQVRADAVGLLARLAVGGPSLSARPTAFVEDCAVPVQHLPSFVADFRTVLENHQLSYGMFGHADVGCIHVRPALDLTDPGHEALVRTVTDEVVALVERYGGVLWGEHGRGYRGQASERLLSPETQKMMEKVKAVFDPDDRFNPGKLYRPFGSRQSLTPLDGVPTRGQSDRQVDPAVRSALGDAFACNGNAACHNRGSGGAMCPSYRVTGDPALSPKGRADLVRAWAADPNDDELADALAANLHQCLSCAACASGCPVEVDIPELKSRFFEAYYQNRSRPMEDRILALVEPLAMKLADSVLPLPSQRLNRWLGSLVGLVDLPSPQRRLTKDVMRFSPKRGSDSTSPAQRETETVVLLPDVFSAALDPQVELHAVQALERAGWTVLLAPFLPSAKFQHVKGRRSAFAALAEDHGQLVRQILDAQATPAVIEPAVHLLYQREYPSAVPVFPSGVAGIAQLLNQRRDRLEPIGQGRTVRLLSHCTEASLAADQVSAWAKVLDAAGYRTVTPDIGCCGMAGIFGHEATNQQMSRQLWYLSWEEHFRSGDLVAVPGYSCRSQARRFGPDGAQALHPVSLLLP